LNPQIRHSAQINCEYSVINRIYDQDSRTWLIVLRLASAIDDPESGDDQLLNAGEVGTIFSRADLELPVEKYSFFVLVGGEVNAPKVYRVNPGETLSEVVVHAGRLTSHSDLHSLL
jgi:LysM repeat protein